MQRRSIVKLMLGASAANVLGGKVMASDADKAKALLKFGVVADPQYADIATRGSRFYRNSLKKLGDAIEHFNKKEDLSFVVTLGDTIDKNFKSFDDTPIYYEAQTFSVRNSVHA